jgi:uncharacterized cupredoxin-like copper-binding protein
MKMRKSMRCFATALLLTVCGTLETFADDKTPTASPNRVTVRLQEYRFDPPEILLKAGEESELILVNQGTVLHEFVTEALQNITVDVEVNGVVAGTLGVAEMEIPPKAKVMLRFTPEKPGEFSVACHARKPKDHFKEGMVGRLTVLP